MSRHMCAIAQNKTTQNLSWLQGQAARSSGKCRFANESGNDRVDMHETAAKPASARPEDLTAEELALARLIITALNLEIDPSGVDPQAPLYGEGLGLDSIDILEIALAISQTYKIKLRSDDANNQEIFSSLRSLNRHIQQHRAG